MRAKGPGGWSGCDTRHAARVAPSSPLRGPSPPTGCRRTGWTPARGRCRGDVKGDRYIFPRIRENPASVWGLSAEERVANSTLPTPLGAANRLGLFVGSLWIRMHTEVCGPVGEVIRVGLVSPRGLASPSGRLAWLGGVDRGWGALRSTSGLRQTSLFGVGRAGIRGLPAGVCLFWARARYSTERGSASGFCDEPTGAVRNRNGP